MKDNKNKQQTSCHARQHWTTEFTTKYQNTEIL